MLFEDLIPIRGFMLMYNEDTARIVNLDKKKKVIVIEKEERVDDPWYPGHFPGKPVMPGIKALELMFQAAIVLMKNLQDIEGEPAIARLENAIWVRPVMPGSILEINVTKLEMEKDHPLEDTQFKFRGTVKAKGVGYVARAIFWGAKHVAI
jgi:3-hydroxymyristoyl/3-hydroxydecanoyl-(acyl carrier protein) dehydratase